MSIATLETNTSDSCLTSLQNLLQGHSTQLQWLTISHNDPVMNRCLAEVVDDDSTAILQLAQGDWKLDENDLPTAVRWAINEAGVEHLLMVGHSDATVDLPGGDLMEQDSGPALNGDSNDSDGETIESSYQRLLAGATHLQDRIQHAKDHFVDQLCHLCELPEVQDGIMAGRLHLHMLFYLAHVGTFLKYNAASDSFEPLVA